MAFKLIFRTTIGEYRTNHYGVLENGNSILRIIGCIDPAKYESLDGFGCDEHQLLMNMEAELREKAYLVLQISNSKEHLRSYKVIPETIDRIIYENADS